MELSLPPQIASKRDVIKLQRQIEEIMDQRLQSQIAKKQTGEERAVDEIPGLTAGFFEYNSFETSSENLKAVAETLEVVKQKAPVVRIAFASEPDFDTAEKVVKWFRTKISPLVFVQIGVQPMIAGGCVVQTPMKRYDFSLRKKILGSTDKLLEVFKRVS